MLNCFQTLQAQVRYDDFPVTVKSNAERNAPRNGVTPFYVPIGTSWNHRIITYFFANGTADIAGNDERQAIRDAFALWRAQTNLAFLEVCNENDADIVFLWGAGAHGDPVPDCYGGLGPFDGTNGTLAHNMGGPGPNNCGAQSGDIHFDEDETWTLNTRNDGTQPIDLVTVAAHEMGHALGLFHTTVAGSLMLGNYTGSHRFLGSDDIAGIRSIYGTPDGSMIAGNTLVCTSGTQFSIPNLPAGTTVAWSVSPAYLVSNAAGAGTTFTPTAASSSSSGEATITATITGACGTAVLTKSVWVGVPNINVNVFSMTCIGRSEFEWIIEPYSDSRAQVSSYQYSNCVTGPSNSIVYCGSSGYVVVGNPNEFINMDITAITTSAGCGSSTVPYGFTPSICASFAFAAYPNPATRELIVEARNDERGGAPEYSLRDAGSALTLPDHFTVKLYNNFNALLREGKSNNGKITLDVKGIKPGIYLLQIDTGKEMQYRHIQVN